MITITWLRTQIVELEVLVISLSIDSHSELLQYDNLSPLVRDNVDNEEFNQRDWRLILGDNARPQMVFRIWTAIDRTSTGSIQ